MSPASLLVPSVVTKATAIPVSVDECKKHGNITATDDDALIADFLQTAFDWLQPPDGVLRVSIATQTLRLSLPCWPSRRIELPAGPVQQIVSVRYFDQNNADVLLSSSEYFQDRDWLQFAETFTAPSLFERPSAVRIEYDAGFASPAATPAFVKSAIKMLVANWYEQREAVSIVGPLSLMPLGVDDLIGVYRVR